MPAMDYEVFCSEHEIPQPNCSFCTSEARLAKLSTAAERKVGRRHRIYGGRLTPKFLNRNRRGKFNFWPKLSAMYDAYDAAADEMKKAHEVELEKSLEELEERRKAYDMYWRGRC
jgi:hypothetical protein